MSQINKTVEGQEVMEDHLTSPIMAALGFSMLKMMVKVTQNTKVSVTRLRIKAKIIRN